MLYLLITAKHSLENVVPCGRGVQGVGSSFRSRYPPGRNGSLSRAALYEMIYNRWVRLSFSGTCSTTAETVHCIAHVDAVGGAHEWLLDENRYAGTVRRVKLR